MKKLIVFSVILMAVCGAFVIADVMYLKIKSERGLEMKDISNPISKIEPGSWEDLSGKSFFFGHQSVGGNIIDGLQKVVEKSPQIKLTFVEGNDPDMIGSGIFLHEKLGENTKPNSKISDFVKVINGGIGAKTSYAFLKLCYVDFNSKTNAEKVFQEYKERIETLKTRYPGVTFVHFTAPLMADDNSIIKGSIKRLLGHGRFAGNVVRNKYNRLLKSQYGGVDPVFDLAYYESISALTGEVSAAYGFTGKKYLNLHKDNTDDGGHLNSAGREWVAKNLLAFLAKLGTPSQT